MVIASNNDRHFLSFSRKLFLSVISLFLVFAACFIAYQYQREKEYKVELLDTQLQDYNERLQQELRSIPDSLWTSTLNRYIAKGSYRDLRVTIVNLQAASFMTVTMKLPKKHSAITLIVRKSKKH